MIARDAEGRRHIDVTAYVTLFIACLFSIPQIYVIRQAFGGLGAPAIFVGWGALLWWGYATIYPDSGIHRCRQPIRIALFAFLGTLVMSLALANLGEFPADQARLADRGILYIIAIMGISLLIADGIDTLERLETLFRRFVLAASLIAIIGIIEYETKANFVGAFFDHIPVLTRTGFVNFAGGDRSFTSIGRVAGTATHPIEFGVVLAMALPFAAHFALTDQVKRGWRRWWKVLVIMIAELMAQSRSGLLVIVVATLVLLPAWPQAVRRRIYIGFVPALIVARVMLPGLLGTIESLFLGYRSDPSYQSRVARYPKIFHFISQHPLFGRGFQTFDAKTFFPVDNQFLMSLIETGIIGTLIFIALLVTAITLAAKSAKWARTENERLLTRALTASIAGVSVAFLTFDFFSYQMATGSFFLLVGSAAAMWRIQRQRALDAEESAPAEPVRLVT